ncbi:MAG: hypothetical protein ACI9X0_000624, partial [Kiritimatiellia bacterium]
SSGPVLNEYVLSQRETWAKIRSRLSGSAKAASLVSLSSPSAAALQIKSPKNVSYNEGVALG